MGRVGTFDDVLRSQRSRVIESLAQLLESGKPAVIEKVLNVRGPLLDRAVLALDQLVQGRPQLLPAWKRYTGVVWQHMEVAAMTPSQRRRLLIPSGLYGITTGEDPVADYRLKMDVSLPPLGRIARLWRPHLTTALIHHVSRSVVVDLLPKEHRASIDWDALSGVTRVIHVEFLQANGRAAAGHAAKAVKGVIARTLVESGLDGLEDFVWQGWHIENPGQSLHAIAPK